MTKGTQSFGKRHTKSHTICLRCGRRSWHKQHKRCASCGYPDARIRQYNWSVKSHRRRTTGTGRKRYLKTLTRRFHAGFREGAVAKSMKLARKQAKDAKKKAAKEEKKAEN